MHPILFSADHVPDIVGPSGRASDAGIMTTQEIIAALKDTCVMMDEKKAQFELIIHSLERKDAVVEKDLKENEDYDAEITCDGDAGSKEDSSSSSEAE